jgi:nitrile hydratase accessory protein
VKPPRSFEQPWESRTFGAAIALSDGGLLDFEQFRAALIAEIQGPNAGSYYEHWQRALERMLAQAGVVSPGELTARAERHASAARSSHAVPPA